MAARARLDGIARHLAAQDAAPRSCAAAEADLVIRRARIVDGTGSPAFDGDVAVTAGKISYVGARFTGAAAQEVDAAGKFLLPGFIDIHTHFDPQLCWDGRADPSLLHGVTTVVTGNCSLSLAPVATRAEQERIVGMFSRIEDIKAPTFAAGVPFDKWTDFRGWLDYIRPKLTVNVGALLGHSVVRLHVMGKESQERAATPAEIRAMCDIVESAMRAGAIGVSSSYIDADEFGKPVPSRYSNFEEKLALAQAMAKSGRGVWQVVPDFTNADNQLDNIRELGEISRRAGVLCSFQPVLTTPTNPLRTDITEALEREAAKGARVLGQVTPRDFNMNMRLRETSMLLMAMPSWHRIMQLPHAERLRKFADPAVQPRLVTEMKKRGAFATSLAFLTVGDVAHPDNQKYRGREVREIAAEEGKEMGQVLLDISVRDGLDAEFRVEGVLNADKKAIAKMLDHPLLHVGASDAGAHITQFCGTGDTTILLQQLVKPGRLAVEAAVHRLTGQLAQQWGIADRGVVRRGMAADLVLLDMGALDVGPLRFVADFPGNASRYTRGATGFDAVFVNGRMVVEKDRYTDATGCGQVV